ncbi:MAG TPA: hypothetical protein VK255_01280 [Patescibacteria group bacterium]|nr:hypothetical protein [Patescibacteria group bacterium]
MKRKFFSFGSPVLFPKRLDGGSGASERGGKTAGGKAKIKIKIPIRKH